MDIDQRSPITEEPVIGDTTYPELHTPAPVGPTFTDLGVREETVAALAKAGITHAFAIQEYAIPIALRGVDLIGQAPTGTGKTLGFGVPLLQRVTGPDEGSDGVPQALVVVPTRELGLQVARDIQTAGRDRGIRVLPVYGGIAYEPQVAALAAGVEIIVGTPGRLLDLSRSHQLRLDRVESLVLDEADRMLDLGFLDDVEKILSMLPNRRQTMLFSATMPDPIVALARRFLSQPVTIHATHPTADGPSPLTRHVAYRTHPMNKVEVVARILQVSGRGLTMIFTRTKRAADRLAEELDFRGFASAAVHGDLGQGARERALRAFRAGKIDVLVATDVAARGLDVFGVTHVINYDCPEDAEAYVHRTGRTGRAGATGVAVTFVDWEDLPRWRLIDKSLNLEIGDPPETYHTSAHLFTDLNIDPAVSGTLPSAERTRAGLSAEVLENVEGDRGPRGRGGSGRPRQRSGGQHSGGQHSGGQRSGGQRSGGQRGDGQRGDGQRGGQRGSAERPGTGGASGRQPDSTGPAGTPGVAGTGAGDEPVTPRRRRRRITPVTSDGEPGAGRKQAGTGPGGVVTATGTDGTGHTAVAAAANGGPIAGGNAATGEGRRRRRRRGGSGRGAAADGTGDAATAGT